MAYYLYSNSELDLTNFLVVRQQSETVLLVTIVEAVGFWQLSSPNLLSCLFVSRLILQNKSLFFILVYISSVQFIFGVVYLPPNSLVQLYESHVSSIENILSIYSPHSIIICGDYNLPNINWASDNLGLVVTGALTPSAISLVDSLSLHNFFQCNSVYNSYDGLLYLVFSNFSEISVGNAVFSMICIDTYRPLLMIN